MIKKIFGLVAVFILTIYNTCFADEIAMPRFEPSISSSQADSPLKYIIIGIFVLIVALCAIFIIRSNINKNKEKENDTNNNK